MYDPRNAEDDMIEMEEERLRMREHVMNEVCFKARVCVASVIHQVLALIPIIRRKNQYTVGIFYVYLSFCVSACLYVYMYTCTCLVPEKA